MHCSNHGGGVGAAWCRRSAHQLQPIEIHGLPVCSVHPKGKALFGPRHLDHHGSAVPAQFDHSVPEQVAHATGDSSDEDTWRDLQQPSGDVAAQTRWNRREHEHYQGMSP